MPEVQEPEAPRTLEETISNDPDSLSHPITECSLQSSLPQPFTAALEPHDNVGLAADALNTPNVPAGIGASGRPQRRGAHLRFDLTELKKCTCDQDAEKYPEGGIIQCKNTKCVTKWVCMVDQF